MDSGEDRKKIYGLLGRDISYSLSPAMHNAAFKYFKLNAAYELFDKKENEVEAFLRKEVLSGKISGINVTVPYKIKALEIIEKEKKVLTKDKWVNITKAINTIKVEGNSIKLCNTDALGFLHALMLEFRYSPTKNNKDALLIGAGGAGRVICHCLLDYKRVGKIKVFDIDKQQMEFLVSAAPQRIFAINSYDDIKKEIASCDIVINATRLGTEEGDAPPLPLDLLKEGMVVCDLVYARETELIKKAKEKNLKAVDGLDMLAFQGSLSFGIWTGKGTFVSLYEIMKKAAIEELSARRG